MRWLKLCVRRPVFATMLIVSLTVVGLYSFMGLGVDLMPNIDLPTVSVTVTNPGASPEQIESEITKEIEGAVNTISGIDQLRSSSVEGVSQVNHHVPARKERRRRLPRKSAIASRSSRRGFPRRPSRR